MSNNSSIEVPNICTISSNSETFSASSSQPDYSCEDHDEDDDGDDDDLINVGTFTIMQPRQDAVAPFMGIKALQAPAQTIFDFSHQLKQMRPRLNSNEPLTSNVTHAAPWMMTASLTGCDYNELTEDDLYETLMT